MAHASDYRVLLLQNPVDAGCDKEMAHTCQKKMDGQDCLMFRWEHGEYEGGVMGFLTLHNSVQMPMVGFAVWDVQGEAERNAILTALELG